MMGIDLGTSSVKVIVSDWKQGIVARSIRSYDVQTPAFGYAEQNPNEWLHATIAAILEINTDILQQIAGIAFTGQMHAVLAIDESFRPLTPAMLWFDTRAHVEAQTLAREFRVKKLGCGDLVPDPTLPLSKIRWLRDKGNLDWSKAIYVIGAKDWIRCQFGGSLLTDGSEASGTQLFDVLAHDWDQSLVQAAGIEIQNLPKVVSSTSVDGGLCSGIAKQTRLPEGCPLFVGGGDFPTAMGLLDFTSGDVVINIGTAGQIATRTNSLRRKSGFTRFAEVHSKGWLELIPLLSIGLCMTWWHGILGNSGRDRVWPSGSSKRPSTHPLVFLPQIAGERPWHPNPVSFGGFLGLRAEHSTDDLSLAVMEGVVMSVREAFDQLLGPSEMASGRIFLTGSREFTLLMAEEISSALGRPIRVRHFTEPTAEGAAYLAFLGNKVADGTISPSQWSTETTVAPNAVKMEHYQSLYRLYQRARGLQSELHSYF
ncbi:hypothetical protein LSG31_17020 [Fodinisporobacter ferrooxydans]|uniref:Xylulokinase n=1 Tax=Fodinisporobacter ferrooxydans TaxID=2901836 RepID=A0ABY4CQY0_9BACL|nr:hypothetical protein LSG31_17020 [Alicyclobacillaceae bacterium MYW30-H2]